MSGHTDKYWYIAQVKNHFENSDEEPFTMNGGPASEEILKELKKRGYIVSEFSDFENIYKPIEGVS